METRASSLDVKLLGQRFALKYPEADSQVAAQALALVERKIREAAGRNRDSNPLNTAVLALLELAEEYVRAKGRTAEWQKQVTDKSARIFRLIEPQSAVEA